MDKTSGTSMEMPQAEEPLAAATTTERIVNFEGSKGKHKKTREKMT